MKKNAVPIVALLVASAAIIGILGLRQHESSARRAQLRLTTATGALNALQGLPFHGDPADPVAAEVPARMRASEGQILTTLVDLDGGDSAKRSLLIAPVQLNFASLDRVYEWSAGGQKPAAAGPRLADVSQRTLVPALAQLRARSDFYAHAARTAEVESIVGSIAAIVMLLGAFWFYFTRSANVRRRERQAYAELDVAQAERKRLLVRTVQAAEDERTRIARDLHDGPIQRLTAAAFTLDLLGRKLARGERALDGLIAQVREQLTGEMESLRRLMSDLRPQLLDEGDVAAAIRDCAVGVLPPETACDVQDRTGNASLTRDLETVVYRVAREAIVNVQKHANASKLTIALTPEGDTLRLTVIDDGVGFDTDNAETARLEHHLGLIAMQERVESVGGTWDIDSTAGAGTRIDAILPWPRQTSHVGNASSGAHATVA
jgi:signal transduction histidine kinase